MINEKVSGMAGRSYLAAIFAVALAGAPMACSGPRSSVKSDAQALRIEVSGLRSS
jgi:hypothetical protein